MKFPMLPARVALAVVGAAILTAIGCTAIPWQPPPPISIAVATSLTGLSGAAGAESLFATKLYVDEVNRSGGINRHPIELVLLRHTSNPEVGRDNVQTIADSPCVAVLGHLLSTVSLAAAPDYRAARIPALTGTSSVDALTVDNPYYFRARRRRFPFRGARPPSICATSSRHQWFIFSTLAIASARAFSKAFLRRTTTIS